MPQPKRMLILIMRSAPGMLLIDIACSHNRIGSRTLTGGHIFFQDQPFPCSTSKLEDSGAFPSSCKKMGTPYIHPAPCNSVICKGKCMALRAFSP